MVWWTSGLPATWLWAQAAGASGAGAGGVASTASTSATALAWLALRRWCSSLTLATPGPYDPGHALWAWVLGLAGLLLLGALLQGPFRLAGQLFDVAGHVRLVADAYRRTRRASRMLAVVIGTTVLSWTGSQAFVYEQSGGREDFVLLMRSRTPQQLGLEQGLLAALTPLRDVAGLATNLPLLVLASILLFRATAESWGARTTVVGQQAYTLPAPPGWASVGWTAGGLFAVYRLVSMATPTPDLPVGGCLTIEGLLAPIVMALADGILLAWILSELRHAGYESPEFSVLDVTEASYLMPGAAIACLAALPARYLATGLLLTEPYLPTAVRSSPVGSWFRWQLTWGLIDVQAFALVVAGIVGAVAWSQGGVADALSGYVRLLRRNGARVFVVFLLAGMGAGLATAVAYFILCSLPASTWVLNAADSYAHYVSLPFGLWTLAALIELTEQTLPQAELAALDAVAMTND